MCHMTLRGVGLKTHLKHAQLRVIHAAIAVHTKEMDYTLHDPSFIGLWWCDRPGRNDSTVCTKTYMNDSYCVFQWSFRLCEVTPTHPFLMWQSLACMFLNSPTMEGFWLVVEREGERREIGFTKWTTLGRYFIPNHKRSLSFKIFELVYSISPFNSLDIHSKSNSYCSCKQAKIYLLGPTLYGYTTISGIWWTISLLYLLCYISSTSTIMHYWVSWNIRYLLSYEIRHTRLIPKISAVF
jgi:hypothetical protein